MSHMYSGVIGLCLLASWSTYAVAADSLTIMKIDESNAIVTVKSGATGETKEIQVGNSDLLEGMTVGQVIHPPTDDGIQSRAATKPPTMSYKGETCFSRCVTAGSTVPQCLYYCF